MSEVDPGLLAEFNALTERAADFRRHSYGSADYRRRSNGSPSQLLGTPEKDEEGRSYFSVLSHHLWLIHHMVELHPELADNYREWRLLYPTFSSD